MARRVSVEVVMDDASYIAGASNVVSTNTKMGTSNVELAKTFKVSADAQIAAAVKGAEAARINALNLRGAAANLPAGSTERAVATEQAAKAERSYARAVGETTVATRGFSSANRTAERDIGKTIRGGLAGSGVFSGLGRSLAFASSGFIATAVAASGLAESIKAADSLAKAQESLSVAIEHTGGNAKKLAPIYAATAKAAAQFGVNQADATLGLARATELTGGAAKAQRAYQEALVISKATGKDFNSVLTATSKAQEGVVTSLRRYGILVTKGESGTAQFAQVMQRFGGQASANTTAMERLRASFTNTLAVIGTALLPTVNKLAGSFANWLNKMNESGKLQKDVAAGMTAIHDTTEPLIKSVHALASAIGLATSAWHGYNKAAASIPKFFRPPSLHLPSASSFFSPLGPLNPLHPLQPAIDALLPKSTRSPVTQVPAQFLAQLGIRTKDIFAGTPRRQTGGGPFGAAQPITAFKSFTDTIGNQLAQARAALTKGTADDVTAAKQEIVFIKREIAAGHLTGSALIQALGAEATAVGTIQSAETAAAQARAAAAQKRAAAAQKAKAAAQARIENSIDPLKLEVALSKAQAEGRKGAIRKAEIALRAAARKALASGTLTLTQQKEAYDQITSLNQQLASATKKAVTSALGGFKQLNLNKLSSDLGLTPAQRKALQARLSQVGPHGTVPSEGVGAYGYRIGANDRPIHVHTSVNIDGRKVASNTTKHQQHRDRRNSSQRRGPTAGGSG